eukprot:scaffold1610_cov257-Pinguiococcus_pyrenoidosus.AAC.5
MLPAPCAAASAYVQLHQSDGEPEAKESEASRRRGRRWRLRRRPQERGRRGAKSAGVVGRRRPLLFLPAAVGREAIGQLSTWRKTGIRKYLRGARDWSSDESAASPRMFRVIVVPNRQRRRPEAHAIGPSRILAKRLPVG